jgi:phosphomethylpyrimidine synthase
MQRDGVIKSAALTPDQRTILENRGVLSPEEIHRLASKTKQVVGAERGAKAACHSDVSAGEQARALQGGLVRLRVSDAE